MSGLLRIIFKVIVGLVVTLAVVVVGIVVAVNVSPRPVAWVTQRTFAGGIGVEQVNPAGYDELKSKVRVEKDIEYPSKFADNRFDIFTPKDATGPTPTILFPHGGGFVGGDKAGLETWATMIAGRGYTVLSINYQLAPDNTYPGPLIQLAEVYDFLKQNPQRFPTVDLRRLIFGGDSAGAQMASQFVAMQTNPELAKSMAMTAVVPKEDIRGAILFCGPYNLKALYDGEKWFGRFFVRQMGWAYFGIKDWRDTPQAAQAATVDHVTSDFPPTFITDGNTASFEPDARLLEARLKEKGVEVESLYYPVEHAVLGHEYQFDFSKPEAMEAYNRTVAFLERVSGR